MTSPLAVSPDGRLVAILASRADGRRSLWVRSLDTLVARELPGTDGAIGPFWSPDSQSLGFFADRKLKKVALAGGPPVTVCDTPTFNSASWGRDGVIIFAEGPGNITPSPIKRVSASGGVPTDATVMVASDPRTNHLRPVFLHDGRHFLYRINSGALFAASLDSPERTLVMPNVGNLVYAAGHLLFLREATLMAQPFDLQRLALTGEPIRVAEQILNVNAIGLFTASDTVLAYQTAPEDEGSRLTWLGRDGRPVAVVGDPGPYADLVLSPDGGRALVKRASSAGNSVGDLWLVDLASGAKTPFALDVPGDRSSVWSPDGGRVIFTARPKGPFDLYQRPSNGAAGSEELLLADALDKTPISVSADGRFLLYESRSQNTRADLWILPLVGERRPRPFVQTPFNENRGSFSPNGRWIAFASNESGTNEIYVAPFPGPGEKRKISTAGGGEPSWRRDGKELYFVDPANRVMSVAVDSEGPRFDAGAAQRLFLIRRGGTGNVYNASADGQRFLVNVAAPISSPSSVVVNWAAGLKK